MRIIGVMLAAFVTLVAGVQGAVADDYYGKQKVVYHINMPGGENDKAYLVAMNNIRNHINAVGADNVDLKVVMHGDGVDLVKDARTNMKLQTAVSDLKSRNVGFLVCKNTLTGRKIDPDNDLFDVYNEDIVPSGVAELSRLQQMGYTYIRP